MRVIDNKTEILRDDLKRVISPNSKVSVAAAFFSLYAYEALKTELETVNEFHFLYTQPTFVEGNKERREFYIPQMGRESSLYGTEFEIKLRNELTQKAVAQECAKWIQSKAKFKTLVTDEKVDGALTVKTANNQYAYTPFKEFTTVGLGCERGNYLTNFVIQMEAPESRSFIQAFDELWRDRSRTKDITETVIRNITSAYAENPPDLIYYLTLFHIFSDYLEDLNEDHLPNEATGFKDSKIWGMLYDFQKDAALALISKLEQYNGCILADSVGLGKTFTALAVIKYYENRNKNVLVLCPKKLSENWNTYKNNYSNNPIAADRLRYDVLFHTDLSRTSGTSNGMDLERLNWGNYDLVVIDESHNFRNGGEVSKEDGRENRYRRLMNQVIRAGVKTKVLMLSATPVNNRFTDLKNQLALAYEGNSQTLDKQLGTKKTIEVIFRQAQTAFNAWSKMEESERTTRSLQDLLDFDFFELLDSVTIARSRKHIEQSYNTAEIGQFPTRLKPISRSPHMTDLSDAINYEQIFQHLDMLNLHIYTPSAYIQASKLEKYQKLSHSKSLTQQGREQGIRKLMAINLLKRLESSVYAFRLTLQRIHAHIEHTISVIEQFEHHGVSILDAVEIRERDFDYEDVNTDYFTVGTKVQIDLCDMDVISWKSQLLADEDIFDLLILMMEEITPEHDLKLRELKHLIADKISNPINPGNRKIIIFTAFADTAEYLYQNISEYAKRSFGLESAMVTGTVDGRTTIKGLKPNLNNILSWFSPISKHRALLDARADEKPELDILIATDCISEGQNLQDCDYLINYDIHWNPVRIIQRFGRIDRIGSQNTCIQLVNFWPDMSLDSYINLKSRVETRMRITVMTSTGDDDLLNDEETGDLAYRKQQLERLKNEVVDLEDMSTGISIMDLGLNEFRLDLLDYKKKHPDLEQKPKGLHAVVPAEPDSPAGVIFVLKNIGGNVDVDNQNRIHPYYMVYIGEDGETICDHLNPKKLLEMMRHLCKGKDIPYESLCTAFNQETEDGRDMSETSELLTEAIIAIIDAKDESDLDSLFRPGGTSLLSGSFSGLQDFELITFLVVR